MRNFKKAALYAAVLFLFLLTWLLMGASCSFTTANVKNALMTTAIDESNQPADSVTEFDVASTAYLSAELHNAPDDTTITFVWYYEGEVVDRVSIDNQGYSDTMLSSNMGVPQAGAYMVEVYIDDREDPDQSVEFTVK